ncbi:MAG TPA: hypothetical protein VH701_25875 [Vicinamibacterales bacterium]
MVTLIRFHSRAVLLVLAWLLAACGGLYAANQKEPGKNERPSLSLKLNPRTAMAPAQVTATVELKGGSNNFEEYYCATIEWDWDDGSRSETTPDCEPYDEITSEIRRRYTVQHNYRRGGFYRVSFRLKKKDKVLALVTSTVQVSGGNPFADR